MRSNRYTLLGADQGALLSLLRQRLARDGIEAANVDDMFRVHMNRGVIILAGRLKGIDEMHAWSPKPRALYPDLIKLAPPYRATLAHASRR